LDHKTLNIVIPMAGFGTRLRPHTWSRPKQLISLAGKPVLAHVLDTFRTLPDPQNIHYTFIVGYLGEQIQAYMQASHPELHVTYIVQEEMRGQSHAISLAKEHLNGPMLMVYADTLVETDLSFLANEKAGGVAWVKAVPDPRRFGVAILGPDGWVTKLIEKPKEVDNNLAVVGFYYFQSSEDLLSAIEEQMHRDIQLTGEYFLTDAVNIMLERGLKMRTQNVDVWLDAGTPQDVLNTNRYLLEHGRSNGALAVVRTGVTIIPPVYVHPKADLRDCVIGPYASIGDGCCVQGSIIRNTILEEGAQVTDAILDGSLLGRNVMVQGRPDSVIAGDNTLLTI
jgi:glucose-1-phosphate thymidylyltransferase